MQYISAVLFLVVLACLHLYQRVLTRREHRMLGHLPTWIALPIIGNVHKFIANGLDVLNILNLVLKSYETTKLPLFLWFFNRNCLLLTDPEEIKVVSNSSLNKPYLYKFIEDILGGGLITANGPIWKQNIKKLGSAFRASNVDAFLEIFNNQAQNLVKKLEAEINGDPFELQDKYLANVTLRAICESAIGVSASGDMIDEKFIRAFIRMTELIALRILNICSHFETVYRLTPAYQEYVKCVSTVKNLTEKVLRQRIRDMETKSRDGGDKDCCKASVMSFLDILLEMRQTDSSLTEEQIKDEVTTILLAGLETTASAINFIFLILAKNLDVQRTLYEEIQNVLGDDTRRPVSKEELDSLSYCEAVIYETLRLYPPVPAVSRHVDSDVQLKSCTIPKGTICFFLIWCSGRSKHVWGDDALLYRPERWLDPTNAFKMNHAWLIFSTGKRTCIGRRYAFNLMKTILVHCLRQFEFISEAGELPVKMDMLHRPSNTKSLLQIRRRDKI